MTVAVLLTIALVSIFGLVSSSPTQDLSIPLVDKIRRADALGLVRASAESRRSKDDRLEIKATDLLRSVIRIVQSYSDDDFGDLLKAVQEKIEKIDNPDKRVVELKKGILKKLKDMQVAGAAVGGVKGDLGDVLTQLQDSKYDGRAIKLDSADKRASALKLLTTLNDLDTYRFKSKRADISLSDVVRGGLEALASLLSAHTVTPRAGGATTSTSTEPPAPAPAPPSVGAGAGAPAMALGEMVLLSLMSLPALSSVRLQLVKEKQVDGPNK